MGTRGSKTRLELLFFFFSPPLLLVLILCADRLDFPDRIPSVVSTRLLRSVSLVADWELEAVVEAAGRAEAFDPCPVPSPGVRRSVLVVGLGDDEGASLPSLSPLPSSSFRSPLPPSSPPESLRSWASAVGDVALAHALLRSGAVSEAPSLTFVSNVEPSPRDDLPELLDLARQGRLRRVVVGLPRPEPGLRNRGVRALRAAGVEVEVLSALREAGEGVRARAASEARELRGGEAAGAAAAAVESEADGRAPSEVVADDAREKTPSESPSHVPHPSPRPLLEALRACLLPNLSLYYMRCFGLPFSLFKYATTADGAIACVGGDSRWVSGPESRASVHRVRRRCDAVVVGAETVRRDDPQLTTRAPGHQPWRVVVSRNVGGLPTDAKLWDVGVARTIVYSTAESIEANAAFVRQLQYKGIEVYGVQESPRLDDGRLGTRTDGAETKETRDAEMPAPSPFSVARHLASLGATRCLWECGGTLAAAAIAEGALQAVRAFIAPKIIGAGGGAPSPVGELGLRRMVDAVKLREPRWSLSGADARLDAYLSGFEGVWAVLADICRAE